VSLLVVGSIALDDVESPAGRVEDALGGATCYFAVAAQYFTQVRAVGVVGDDFPAEHLHRDRA
jgi:sugar/nucleoside kinase (ribokinase family)